MTQKNFRSDTEEKLFKLKTVASLRAPPGMVRVILKRLQHHTFNNQAVQVSIWFDGNCWHPLIETVDAYGSVTSGRQLRHNIRLIAAMRYAEDWVLENCVDVRVTMKQAEA